MPKLRSEIHSCKRKFQFNVSNSSFVQDYNLYDLTNGSKFQNLNYAYNNNLKIVELEKMIEELVSKTESKFKRQ